MAVMVVFLSCRTSKTCICDMIQRRKGYGKREPLRDAHKIYIVCVENVEIMTNVFLSQKWGTFLGKRDVMFLFFFFFRPQMYLYLLRCRMLVVRFRKTVSYY